MGCSATDQTSSSLFLLVVYSKSHAFVTNKSFSGLYLQAYSAHIEYCKAEMENSARCVFFVWDFRFYDHNRLNEKMVNKSVLRLRASRSLSKTHSQCSLSSLYSQYCLGDMRDSSNANPFIASLSSSSRSSHDAWFYSTWRMQHEFKGKYHDQSITKNRDRSVKIKRQSENRLS